MNPPSSPRTRAVSATDPLPWASIHAWVRDGERVVVPSADGSVVCMSEATYAELVARARDRTGPGDVPPRETPRLTAREVEILRAVRDGGTGAEVADRMGLATNTVAQHLHSVRRKYGVNSTGEALAAAEGAGLI